MKLQLYKNGNPIMGSDGIITVDGRSSTFVWIENIAQRNKKYQTNFPHLVADGFKILDKNFKEKGSLITINFK